MENKKEKEEMSERMPKEEISDASKKSALSESYDEVKWEKLQKSPASAMDKGKEMGVPQEELDRFAQDVIARETENKDYGFVYRFRKGMKIGTEEEIRAVGEKAYQFLFENGNFGTAMRIAEDMYGKDSEEWKRANEANKAEQKKTEEKGKRKEERMEDEEQELEVSISKDATFADLFNAIDAIEEDEEFHFDEELWDNFDSEVVEEILAFQDTQASKAATTKVVDFFKERGYSQSDVSAFLPIKFKRERKSK